MFFHFFVVGPSSRFTAGGYCLIGHRWWRVKPLWNQFQFQIDRLLLAVHRRPWDPVWRPIWFFFFLRRVRTWRRSRHFTTVVCWSCPWEPKTCRYLRYCTDGCRHTLTATWAICVCSIWIGRRRFDLKIEISRALLNAMDKFHSQMSNNGGGTARQAAKKDDVCLRLWKAFGRRRKGTQKSAIISSVVDTRRVERLWERSSEVHTRAEVLQTVTPVEKSLTVGDLKAKGQRSGQ